MPDNDHPRLVFKVDLVSAVPIDGTEQMLVTLRTDAALPLAVRLARAEAADLVALIALDRARADAREVRS